jgi:hypothetical protein
MSSTALAMVVTETAGGALVPVALVDQARAFAAEAKAPATRRAYRGAWQAWVTWAEATTSRRCRRPPRPWRAT